MLGMRPARNESLDRPALDRCHGFRDNVLNSWGRERGKRETQGILKGLEREEGGWGRRKSPVRNPAVSNCGTSYLTVFKAHSHT